METRTIASAAPRPTVFDGVVMDSQGRFWGDAGTQTPLQPPRNVGVRTSPQSTVLRRSFPRSRGRNHPHPSPPPLSQGREPCSLPCSQLFANGGGQEWGLDRTTLNYSTRTDPNTVSGSPGNSALQLAPAC